MAAALKHLHASGVAVIAARRHDILVNATSFELKLMPTAGTLIAHVAAAAVADVIGTGSDDGIRKFIEFIRFVRPMMTSSALAGSGSGSSSSNSGSSSSGSSSSSSGDITNDAANRDEWHFTSERAMFLLRWDEWEHEVRRHNEVNSFQTAISFCIGLHWLMLECVVCR
jgi:hypothetical protein